MSAVEAALFDAGGLALCIVDQNAKVKTTPDLEIVAPIPPIVDPDEIAVVTQICGVSVAKEEEGESMLQAVKNARGRYATFLTVLDHRTATFERTKVGSGRFRTDELGSADFTCLIPTHLFADGFESGDTSAWSSTEVRFTNNKMAIGTALGCDNVVVTFDDAESASAQPAAAAAALRLRLRDEIRRVRLSD